MHNAYSYQKAPLAQVRSAYSYQKVPLAQVRSAYFCQKAPLVQMHNAYFYQKPSCLPTSGAHFSLKSALIAASGAYFSLKSALMAASGEEEIGGELCFVIHLKEKQRGMSCPERPGTGSPSAPTLLPVREERYAKSGRLLKVTRFEDVEKFDDRNFPTRTVAARRLPPAGCRPPVAARRLPPAGCRKSRT